MASFKLGKRAPSTRDAVCFSDFITTYPSAPLTDLAPYFVYPMDGNDIAGCCVAAGFDHYLQIVTGLLTGSPKNFTQDQIWDFYKTQNPGFDPHGSPTVNGPGSSHDQGMDIQIFLEYLVAQKYIVGFAKIDHHNEALMKAAVYLGLSIITGVVLQTQQMQQFQSGVWDNVPNGTVDGGHCVPFAGYTGTPDYFSCITWAKVINCTQSFMSQMDEAWFVITQEHIDHPTFRDHFDLTSFSQAVSQITNGKVQIPLPRTQWKYFTPTESTGGGHTVAQLKPNLVNLLDLARGIAGVPFVITSGLRTPQENAVAGGVPDSAHLTGEAADIACSDSQGRYKMLQALYQVGFKRIEICPNHLHCDISLTLPQNVAVLSNNG